MRRRVHASRARGEIRAAFDRRAFRHGLLALALCLVASGDQGLAQPPADDVTVMLPDGRRTVPWLDDGRDGTVPLQALVPMFDLAVSDDPANGRVTVRYDDEAIIVTDGQPLVSVAGQLRSLRAAPRRVGNEWQVPLSFLDQALGRIYDAPIDVRPRSRLVLVGNVRVPRVAARYRPRSTGGQLRLTVTPRAT